MAESVTSVSTNRNLQCEVDSFHFLSAWSCVVILALLRHLKRWEMGQRENIRASTRMCKFHSSYVWNAIKALRNCLKANNAECCNGDCSVLSTTLKKRFADLSGNQLPIYSKHLIGLRIALVKFTYRRLDWAFPALFHYSLLGFYVTFIKI